MKDEKKEKLDGLFETLENDLLSRSQYKLLLDYITNLQEETERQSKAQVILDNQIAEMLKYKERNEKAIEYINTWLVDEYSIAVPDEEEPDVFCEYEPNAIEKLLNILGGDEDGNN